jgi:hypothetical protein
MSKHYTDKAYTPLTHHTPHMRAGFLIKKEKDAKQMRRCNSNPQHHIYHHSNCIVIVGQACLSWEP